MKEIKDFPGYYITICGKVWSAPKRGSSRNKNGMWLKPLKQICKDGSYYLKVCLYKNKEQKSMRLNRLVAEAYIPNHDNKPEVNHKDGNKLNNAVLNLEWNTSGENQRHAWKSGLCENNRKAVSRANSKKVLCVETGVIFPSAAAASKHIGLSERTVAYSIHKNCRSGGYHWKYI
jgi:hypothetical protein